MHSNRLGLGTVQFGLPYGISNKGGQTPVDEVAEVLDLANAEGVTIIDTAAAYGGSEAILGSLHKGRFSIVTKFMPVDSEGSVNRQIEKSMEKLQVESLHGYLAHRPLDLLNDSDSWDDLNDLKAMGKVKKIGFSLNSPEEYYRLESNGMIPDLVQVPFNYFDTRFATLLQELKSNGCEVHTRSAFLQGLFFSNMDCLPSFFDQIKQNVKDLQQQCGSLLQGALLHFVLQHDFIDHVIIGVENASQLKHNIRSLEQAPLLVPIKGNIDEKIVMPVNWPKI